MAKIKHAVMLKFKRDSSPAAIEAIFADLRKIQESQSGILDLTWGPNVSIDGLDQGFTHGFVMTFADEAARAHYLPHPDHRAVVAKIVPELEGGLQGAVVVDWHE